MRNVNRLERFLRIILEEVGELLVHFFRIDIADDDEREIIRNVTRLVILHHLLLRELVVNFDLADHRQAIRMPLIRGGEKELARHPIGIVHAHGEFAPDHFLFLVVFLRRQSRIHHRVGQNIERGRDAVLRHIDPENRAIERRVGVDVTADVLDFLRDRIVPGASSFP